MLNLSAEEILAGLRRYLPADIGAVSLEEAGPRFHARLSCTGKTYVYRIWNSPVPNVFERNYLYFLHEPLDVAAMRRAAEELCGTHDYRAFCSLKKYKKSTVRTVEHIAIEELGPELRLTFSGNGFLYNMVRIIAGTLLAVSDGKLNADDLPQLIVIDGGKGQVSAVKEAIEKMVKEGAEESLLTIPICGMVKDDNHRTRGLLYEGREYVMDRTKEPFKLITRIQDETHRFAIEYHRQLRTKGQVKSILDDIPGIGPKRRLALIRYFKSIDAVKEADLEELLKVEGMNEKAAKSVLDFFAEGSEADKE